jgi:hypothetical protein
VVRGHLFDIIHLLRLFPQLPEVPAGGEGEVSVPGWEGTYLMDLFKALRAGSLKASAEVSMREVDLLRNYDFPRRAQRMVCMGEEVRW